MDRRLRRLAGSDETECGFRVVHGVQTGLTSRWRHGRARVLSGVVEFRPGIGGGVRFARPGQPWVRIEVEESGRAQERTAGLMESWSVSAAARIVRLRTPTGEVEWAVVPEQRDALLERLRGTKP
jgi:hypothetical protein